MTSLKPAPCIVNDLSIILSHNVNEWIVQENGPVSRCNAEPWGQVVVLVVTMVWFGLGEGDIYRGFPGYLTFHRHFIRIYIFSLWSQKRFCCHLDLPSYKTHGFACHILLHLTYFRFCVWKLTIFRGAEYSGCPLTTTGNGADCCHLWHPVFASWGGLFKKSSEEPVSSGRGCLFTLLPDFSALS